MLALLLSTAAALAEPQVFIALEAQAAAPVQVPVALRRANAPGAAPLRATVGCDKPLLLALEPGQWRLDVESDDVWHAPQEFRVEPSVKIELPVRVWPRALLAAAITHDGKAAPTELLVRFEPATEAGGAAGQVRCPITDGRASCAVPAGTYRLRMRPRGFIAHHFDRIELAAGTTHDLGALSFRQGQSISGRVQLPDRFAGDASAVRVTATPIAPQSDAQTPIAARPDKRGFFQLAGVAPGTYRITAALRNVLTSAPVEATLRAGSEAELVDPLRLAVPRRVELLIAPIASPDGAPWHVKLYRQDGRHRDEITESRANADGTWQSPPLQPGSYAAVVGTLSGDEWHRQELAVAAEDVRAPVLITPTEIAGTVKLGERPLKASLTFAGTGSAVKARSDEEGRFRLALPQFGEKLRVDVRADAPWIKRTVTVAVPQEDRSIDIVLPDTLLMGEVVDAAGTAVADATVWITRSDGVEEGLMQPRTRADGGFEAHGLPAGRTYTVRASAFLKASAPVTIAIDGDEPPAPIRLVLEDETLLTGRVVSPLAAVAGARVRAMATNVPQHIAFDRRAGADGRFESALPPGTRTYELTVAAPGFPFVIAGGTLTERPLAIRLEQNGGTLRIRADENEVPYLVHNGGTCPAVAIAREWPSQQQALDGGAQELVLPMMEPGAYAACVVPAASLAAFRAHGGQSGGRCVSGSLSPFGSLTLDLRAR